MTAVDARAATGSLPSPRTASELMARSRSHVPPAPAHHLSRARLSGLLAASTAPLALLSAPAGSGKTALAVEWAHSLGADREVVWVSCHVGDVDPWADVLRRTGTGDVDGGRHDRVEQVVEAAGRSPVPWTVFLDGYDVRSPEAAEELDLLLTYAGDALQVVLTTRADPVLPLHRYRLSGRLLEVRAADLAFTDAEAGSLLRAGGIDLDPDDLHALNERLAGWAAGLRFALPTLASHPAPRALVSSAVTYNGNINAFLVEEVLDAQPPALRDLILTTSVPDTLTPGLLEELTGLPAAPTTLRLMRANVFLESAPGDESGLRYVPFFRSLVLAQLAHEAPERFRRLHRSVAAWYASEGRWDRAVAHLGETGARPDCASLVVDHLLVGRLLCEGRGDPLRRLVATTPAPAGTGTDGHLLRATTALADGDHERCSAHLEAVRGAGALAERAAVTLAVLEAALAAVAGDVAVAERLVVRAEEALASLRRPGDPATEDVRAVLLLARARTALRLGAEERAERLLESCLDSPTATHSTGYRCVCLAHAALLHARTGAASLATAEAEEALAVGGAGGSTSLATTAHLARAYVALATGDLLGARAHLAETCAPPEPLWKVVRALVAAALERSDGADQQAASRLGVAAGAAELAGPWAAEWVQQQESAPRPVGEAPGQVLPGSPWMTGADGRVVEQLTPREVEVLTAMSEWLTTEEIAEKLFVSVNTVRTHVRNILTKLGVSRRNAAIREALRLGLLAPDVPPATPSPIALG
jgi:LuxR family maltose regulon positive regulatory protein